MPERLTLLLLLLLLALVLQLLGLHALRACMGHVVQEGMPENTQADQISARFYRTPEDLL